MARYGGTVTVVGTLANTSPSLSPTRYPIWILANLNTIARVNMVTDMWDGGPTGAYFCTFEVLYALNSGFATVGPSAEFFHLQSSPPAITTFTYTLEWLLGTYSGSTHAADGYLTLSINGSVALSVTGIALGKNGEESWDGVTIYPGGAVSSIAIKDTPTHSLYSESMAGKVNADVFADAGGDWDRSAPSQPGLDGTYLWANTGNYIRRTDFVPGDTSVTSIPVDDADVCSCTGIDPSVPPTGGGTGRGAYPKQIPTIGAVVGCIGGGLVPTQADISFSEQWWGLA